jgi:polyhydroxyalkanoate synthesis regulator phasin
MALEAINNYLHIVSGLTKTTRAKARAAAKAMLAQAGLEGVAADAGERVGKLAEEIMNAGRANRELLETLVAAEVDKAAAKLGFARSSELESLRDEIAELRREVAEQRATGNGATAEPAPAKVATARKATRTAGVRKASAGTAAAKKSAGAAGATRAAPRKAAARKTPARKAAASSARAEQTSTESAATSKSGEEAGDER